MRSQLGLPLEKANAADPHRGLGTPPHKRSGPALVFPKATGKSGWCDAFVGSLMIRLHRILRGMDDIDDW